jgi:hypothetical protein
MVCTRVEGEGAVRFGRASARLALTGAVTRGAYVSPSFTAARSLSVGKTPGLTAEQHASELRRQDASSAGSTLLTRPVRSRVLLAKASSRARWAADAWLTERLPSISRSSGPGIAVPHKKLT